MGAYRKFDLATAASVLDWWHDAGVDLLVDDGPCDWLAAPAAAAAAPVAVAAAPPRLAAPVGTLAGTADGRAVETLPDTMAAFAAWRIGADAPEAGWSGVSLAASGPAQAAVMVLADCPDREDGDAGALLAGANGRLLNRMLAAIGLSREMVHVAAVCARRPAAGRMPRDVEARLGAIARHHVGLVGPRRLLLLGEAASRAVLGADLGATRGSLRPFNHPGGETQVVASFHPRFLREKPACKAEAWKDLQMLVAGMNA